MENGEPLFHVDFQDPESDNFYFEDGDVVDGYDENESLT
jgi:hypothetical protein